MKERVEIGGWLAQAFADNPARALDGELWRSFRQEQFAQFQARGLPTKKEERWKYADLTFLEKTAFTWPCPPCHPEERSSRRRISLSTVGESRERSFASLRMTGGDDSIQMVFVDGQFDASLSSTIALPEDIILCRLREALKKYPEEIQSYLSRNSDAKKYPLASFNAAMLSDGLYVHLPKNFHLEKPLQIISLATEQNNFMMHPCHLVVLEEGSRLTWVEDYRAEPESAYLSNVSTHFFLGANTQVDFYKLQRESKQARHLANIFFAQEKNSTVNACTISLGGQFSRDEVFVQLQGQNAGCHLSGLYGTQSSGQINDQHLLVEHAAVNTQSEMHYRGVLQQASRAIFNGKVIVHPGAQKTVARQMNRNLLRSPQAEAYTKPELEIYADDVQCRHGATVGQMDEEAIFYLCARGIAREEAERILLQAFVADILSAVKLPWLAQQVEAAIRESLEGSPC